MSKIIRNTLILTIITVVAGLGLGLVYEVTKEPIARTEEQAKKEAWQAVFSDVSLGEFKPVDVDQDAADKTVSDLDIKATVDEVCEAADEGYVVTVTDKEGYGGDIKITVGVTKDGTVSGVSILSISETAGLGMRATEAKFQEQYVGKTTDKFMYPKMAERENLLMLSAVRPLHPELLPVQSIQLSAIAKTHFRRVVEYE